MSAGGRLGPYEVIAPLGVGGMGEVYRARYEAQTRLALKILPDSFTMIPIDWRGFGPRDGSLSLNHPHIAQVYGLEDSGDTSRDCHGVGRGPDTRRSPRQRCIARPMTRDGVILGTARIS